MAFEWDERKAQSNRRKHGIAFDVAKKVFADPRAVYAIDPLSPDYGEDRFVVKGFVGEKLLTVTFTERGGHIRLISARKATRMEHEDYHRENPQS